MKSYFSKKRKGAIAVTAVVTLLLGSIAAGTVGATTYFYGLNSAKDGAKPPIVRITSPANDAVLLAGPIKIKGTLEEVGDNVVQAVSVRVDSGPSISATLNSIKDIPEWSALIDISNLGNHTIEAEAINNFGKIRSTEISVIVVDMATAISFPASQTIEATGPLGAVVNYSAISVQEKLKPLVDPTCMPLSGGTFPIGATTVTCVLSFEDDNFITSNFTITVHDSTHPTIIAPPDVTIAKSSDESIVEKISLGSPFVSDLVDEDPIITNDAPLNGFPLGTTLVVWTAIDDYGNEATATQKITVTSNAGTNGQANEIGGANDADGLSNESDSEGSISSGSGGSSTTYTSGGGGGGGGSHHNDSGDDSRGGTSTGPGGNNNNDTITTPTTPQYYTLYINSIDAASNDSIIGSIFTSVSSSNGTILQSGHSPLSFIGIANSTYTVTMTNYDNMTFDHWENQVSTITRTITLDQNITMTAYYNITSIVVKEDTIDPSINITEPLDNSTISIEAANDTITVRGTASDNSDGSGIKIVEVRVDDGSYVAANPIAEGDWSTWSATLEVTAGEHRLLPRATDNAGNQAWNSIYISVTNPSSESDDVLDKFGIEKIYQTKSGGNEWYVNMVDPKSDSMFRNLPSMTKQSDGSWQVSASQVRMEAWSPSNEKWLNMEITEYAKIIGGSNELLQMYSRGGHHTDKDQCLGSAIKGRLYGDGHAAFVKEINHPAYTGNRGSMQATTEPLKDRWIGFKVVIYNFIENGKTYVHMESYIDDDVTDSKGNLVIKNNWKLASVVEDRGGWSTNDPDYRSDCFPVNKDSTHQYRQKDEIINMSGGTSTQNIAAFRSDDLTWDWKYLSVREIQAP